MRPEKRRRKRLRKARKWGEMRDIWLTPTLHYERAKVRRGEKVREGFVLRRVSAFLDRDNLLWVDWPGTAWDGPSYPSPEDRRRFRRWFGKFLRWWVGYRQLEALLAASCKHDRMAENTLVYVVSEEQRKVLQSVFSVAHDEALIRQVLAEARKTYIHMSIGQAATAYVRMLAAWPVEEQTVGKIRRFRQWLGLRIFQPWYRLFNGSNNKNWQKVEQ